MSEKEQIDVIIDLLTDFDEMGFAPTTTVPNPEAYAIDWRNKLTNALLCYRKQSKWISVEDDLSKNQLERVLVFLKDDEFTKPIGFNKIDTDRYIDGKWVRWGKSVTHWTPLPEHPKMKGGTE